MDREEKLRQAMEQERVRRIAQRRRRVFGSVQGLMDCTFARDDGSAPRLEYAKRYVEHWAEMQRENMGLLFWGPAGTGKTFAAACIANALTDREVTVRLITLGEALLNLFSMSGEERLRYLDDLTNCGLLILDDFGVERRTPYAREQVYEIVNRRYLSGRPMIVTTNLTLKELKNADRDDQRIHDRVLERCVPVCFDGPSIRRAKAARQMELAKELLAAPSPAD